MGPTMSRRRSQQEILTALGQRIAELRAVAGLTQDSLSLLSGVDIQAIRRAETGRSALPFERLERVAPAMGVTIGALFEGDEPALPAPGWSGEEAQVIAALRSVPDDRRELVLPIIKVLAGGQRLTYAVEEPES